MGYVECHGTGTALGDPIEVQALGAVLAEGRDRSRPVVLGSVKTNIGHTQAAAGVAGLIKVVLSLQHGRIPKNLHFDAPNPHIAWDELPVKVASEAVAWPRNGAARLAGVSSFGISGTNAHVVLEEAPARRRSTRGGAPARSRSWWCCRRRAARRWRRRRRGCATHLKAHPEQSLGDMAYSLATTRSAPRASAGGGGGDREALVSGSGGSGARRDAGGVGARRSADAAARWRSCSRVRARSGWGWAGSSARRPVFREALERRARALDRTREAAARGDVGASGSASSRLDETAYTQPALFALEVALAALWRSWGVEPDVVAGHSIGELAAAYVAGVFSLEDAARLVAARGRLMQALPRGGAMVSIAASEAEVAEAVAAHAERVSIAAVNGPASVVISGEEAGVLAVSAAFAAQGVRTKRLTVSHAFHSPLMEPMLEEFRRVAESVAYARRRGSWW